MRKTRKPKTTRVSGRALTTPAERARFDAARRKLGGWQPSPARCEIIYDALRLSMRYRRRNGLPSTNVIAKRLSKRELIWFANELDRLAAAKLAVK